MTVTDNLGHVTSYAYNAMGQALTVTNAAGHTTEAVYDSLGQLTEVYYPASGQTGPGRSKVKYTYQYPGGLIDLVETYDESGIKTHASNYALDSEGELLSEEAGAGDGEKKSYEYDALNRLVAVTDGNNNRTAYAYDALGHLVQITYPNANLTTGFDTIAFTDFDEVGRILKRVDGNGVESRYVYDHPEGLLTQVVYPTVPAMNVAISYDGVARPTTVVDSSGTHEIEYNALDMPLTVSTTYTGLPTRTIGYTYHADGSRATMTVPLPGGMGTYSYAYDAGGRLVSLTDPYDQETTWEYNDIDVLTKRTLANGFYTNIERDALGQVTGWANHGPGGGTASLYGAFIYDGISKLKQVGIQLPLLPGQSGTKTYSYSPVHGLARGALAQERFDHFGQTDITDYTYDVLGNVLSKDTTGYVYNADNQLLGENNRFVYDGNGNPTTYNGQALTFDPMNRLTSVAGMYGGTLLEAGYQASGLRAWKGSGGGRRYYLYDGVIPVCELDALGEPVALNTFGIDGLVSRTLIDDTDHTTTYYQFSPLGDVAHRLAEDGTVLSNDTYDAYGNQLTGAGATVDDPFAYKGQYGYYTDGETGLILCTFRYYDPANRRWLTRDPIDYLGGMNVYSYCGGDPINGIDPYGLDWVDDGANFWAGVGDSMTFGITDFVRQGMGCNDVIQHNGGWYIAGEVTETAFEIAITCGSGALKKAAAGASRRLVRNTFRRLTRNIIREGKELHHINPLFGHPGGKPALFPLGGLPEVFDGFVHGRGNLKLVEKTLHKGMHKRIYLLEQAYSKCLMGNKIIAWRSLSNITRSWLMSLRQMRCDNR